MFPEDKLTRLALLIVFIAAFSYGIGLGFSCLREPDTCFLLAMGKWICQHRTLPSTDPFSYTFAMFPQENGLVIYQWLTEVVFYSVDKVFSTVGLTVLCCLVLVYALFITPLRMFALLKINTLRATIIATLMAIGSIERMMLKPEIFSYLFLAFYLEAVVKQEMTGGSNKINWNRILFFIGIMILWVNFHSGFVIGLALLLLFAVRDLCLATYYSLSRKNDEAKFATTYTLNLPLCLLASLLSPYGLRLWQYIPHLYFHPINHYIGELQPVAISMLSHNFPLLFAFVCFSLLAVFRLISGFRTVLTRTNLIYLLMAIIGITLGLLFQRLVAFGFLLMLPWICTGFREHPEQMAMAQRNFLYGATTFLAVIGTLIVVLINHPTIPSISKAFTPPFAALEYIDSKNLQGNLFNDPEFGDVIIWNSKRVPKIFIDTRFDIYSWAFLDEYLNIVKCQADWKKTFANYKIDWVFLLPSAPLCHYLEKDSQWQIAFKNETSEIIVRRK